MYKFHIQRHTVSVFDDSYYSITHLSKRKIARWWIEDAHWFQSTSCEAADTPNAEEPTSPPCTFIPLLKARKWRNLCKTKTSDLQTFIPLHTESVEKRWRGQHVTMSSVMKDLEAQEPIEQKNHVPTMRKNVSTCLKIALSESSSLTSMSLLLTLGRLL